MRVFQLMLRVSSKSIPDAFHKSSRIAAFFAEEGLELFPWYNNIRPFSMSMSAFVLYPTGANAVSEKGSRKRDAVVSVNFSHIKMMFTLLAEPIAVQMRFSKI